MGLFNFLFGDSEKIIDNTKEYYLTKYLYNDKYYIDLYFQRITRRCYSGGNDSWNCSDKNIIIEIFDLNYKKLYDAWNWVDSYKGKYKEFMYYHIYKYDNDIMCKKTLEQKDKISLEELKNMDCTGGH